jgi:alpha-galactosidase
VLDQLARPHLVVEVLDDGSTVIHELAVDGPGRHQVGPLVVSLSDRADGFGWSVANPGSAPLRVMSIGLRWDAGPGGDDPRLVRNGYQSWSPTSVARLGVDVDPSTVEGTIGLVRQMHHADPRVAPAGWLRSELVGLLSLTGGRLLLVGFEGGATHDGTVWARRVDDGSVQVVASSYLGGAVFPAGAERALHDVLVDRGEPGEASGLLEAWADRAGRAGGARVEAPYQVGWCSWYHYFHTISEESLRHNLALAADWPFEVFQLDDGYQAAIGDWLITKDRFPSPLERLAADIAATGATPGIWLAPFLAAPDSELVRQHPDWIARHPSGRSLIGMVNDHWGGPVHTLDTTNPEVLAHIEATAAALVDAGFPYLKLDFTYAPSFDGGYLDPTRTPAERVRAGMEAVRRGAGDGAFLLGCGLPLGAGIGVVDGMRIGADVAPWWDVRPTQWNPPGYTDVEPATRNAWVNTLTRSFMHRKLWLNDPDCLMLRTSETSLSPEAARAWAVAVGVSGGMALVSDDLALLDADARRLLDEVLDLGRASDAEARDGSPPRCLDLLDTPTPVRLTAAGATLTGTPDASGATLERSAGA